MNAKLKLKAQKRTATGRKVKALRREGWLPATVYGKNVDSLSIQIKSDEFDKIYKSAGGTQLIELNVDSESRAVLINNVAQHPLSSQIQHIEFHQVDLKEKVTAGIPVVIVNEAQAVTSKIGLLLQEINEIEIEALPGDLPESFEVDVSKLAAIDDSIKVSDLKISKDLTLITDPEQSVVRIVPLPTQEEAAPTPTAEETSETPAGENQEEAAASEDKGEAKEE